MVRKVYIIILKEEKNRFIPTEEVYNSEGNKLPYTIIKDGNEIRYENTK